MIVYYKDTNGLTMRMDPNKKPIAIILTEGDKFNISHMGHQTIYCVYPDDRDPKEIEAWLKAVKEDEATANLDIYDQSKENPLPFP